MQIYSTIHEQNTILNPVHFTKHSFMLFKYKPQCRWENLLDFFANFIFPFLYISSEIFM